MIKISESYKKNIASMFPSIGEEWLNRIPFIVEKYVEKFNLKNIKVMENLTYNTLLFAESPEYGDIVIKIEIPFKEMTIRESEALILNNGEGACKCLFKDIDDGVVILERLKPGYTLSTVENIDDRIGIFKEVSDKFNILLDDSYKGLPTYKEILMRSKTVTNSDPKKFGIIKELLDKAISEYEIIERNSNCGYLLHSDLYSENIIKSGDTWKAIDPHGFIGPKILDETIFIQKELGDTNFNIDTLNILLEKMSKQCNHSVDQLTKAFFVNYVLNICWDLEVNLDEEHIEKSIEKASIIKEMINTKNKEYTKTLKNLNI